MTSTAFDKGYQAYFDGMELDDNPFQEDTEDFQEWESGWTSASSSEYNDN